MWKFEKVIPDKDDVDVMLNEMMAHQKLVGNNEYDNGHYFTSGFNRGLAWGVHKTQEKISTDAQQTEAVIPLSKLDLILQMNLIDDSEVERIMEQVNESVAGQQPSA